MPCRSDYMEPNDRERESGLVCKLLCYLLPALYIKVPKHVVVGDKEYYSSPDTLDADTDLLCSTCKGLTTKQLDTLVYDGRNAKARELASWWDRHQKADAEREAEEREAKTKKALRKSALSKLSPAERAALGVYRIT